MTDSEPFNRRARRRRRARALDRGIPDFLIAHMAEELDARLDCVTRRFDRVLELGSSGGRYRDRFASAELHVVADPAPGPGIDIVCDEDRLCFADTSFDLILATGTLHSVNDLPGMLALARRILRPDGLLLAAFPGGQTLERLRGTLLTADLAARDAAAARVHPMVDVRAAGGLLQRAGFALPVVDSEKLVLRYGGLFRLLDDLRAMGETSSLNVRGPLRRDVLAKAAEIFADAAEADGKTAETVEILYLTGWAPHPDQPRALRPGSARVSLAQVLPTRGTP